MTYGMSGMETAGRQQMADATDTAGTADVADTAAGMADAVEEAEKVSADLRDALSAAGVKLPSLGLDAVSWAGTAPFVLVELGRCNVDTARKLAAALRLGTGVHRPDAEA
ncbi:hypothetical protein [Streptomyces nitrosporeus]|uniref:hypothetical protein n=1 Tax=Streptomyces nitrosporeus TaxID=28894 RepID=UPI0019B75898|nr:hypothetical protein GCM10010327_49820 [Streptomyces nitrosporeus]